MSRVVSMRLKDHQMERLQHVARRLGKSPSQAAALLLEEALRRDEHPLIEIRDSPAVRQAYLVGTRIAVWHVALIARDYGGDASKVAAHLEVPEICIKAALAYARAFADEIDAAIAENDWLAEHPPPGVEVITVNAAAP